METQIFKEAQIPELVTLQNSQAPLRRHMSAADLREALLDSAREGGRNVCLVYEGTELQGFLAWVEGDHGECFGSPFVAKSELAAKLLLDVLLQKSDAKNWVRVSAFPEELGKIVALKDRGFHPIFEFVEFEIQPKKSQAVILPQGVADCEVSSVSPSEFAHLHNEAFAGVDNSLPMSEDDVKETFSSPILDHNLSRFWRSLSGDPLAFSLVNRNGYLDSIGVMPSAQGRGLGTQLYKWILSRAAEHNFERIFTTVSSRNKGSLRLHSRLGIPEVERRTVWEKKIR